MSMFGIKNDKEENDYFDGPDLPEEEETPPVPKQPEPEPDSPDYWEDESEWEHLRPVKRWRIRLYAGIALVVIILLITFFIWMFRPYVSDASQYGYVDHIEERGSFIKTYEGSMIPYKEIHDTTRAMTGFFEFSTPDSKVALVLKRLQLDGMPARVEYKTYRSRMPWRGDSKTIIIKADTADPQKILPPEYR